MFTSGLLLVVLAQSLPLATSYVSIPFQTKTYYGFDGPWQAVEVGVGDFLNGSSPSSQYTTVDLLPGGGEASFIPTPQYCQMYSPTDLCAAGGSFDPYQNNPSQNTTVAGKTDATTGFDYLGRGGVFMNGTIYARDLKVANGSGSVTIPNAGTVPVSYGNITLPNGFGHAINIGMFTVGGNFQYYIANGSTHPVQVWTMQGYLYNQSIIQSLCYTVHLGSAALNYPGSLIFGGYDRGRTIGPGTTHTETPPVLLDLVIGVEVGSSPFPFDSRVGLLLNSNGVQEPAPAVIEMNSPYLVFPGTTCDALAQILPVTFESKTGFYMWNDADPAFKKIVTSPAYLGFVFQGPTQNAPNVTIKVPFALLNLTLTAPAISSGPRQYFPCVKSNHDDYLLGRAFLQAAFYGTYWGKQSWLAQAPGPGNSSQGLGLLPQDIKNNQTRLEYNDESAFKDSWSAHWTPLPGPTPPQPTAGATAPPLGGGSGSGTTSRGLSTGAKAGIGVGVAAGSLFVAALIGMYIRRRQSRSQEHSPAELSTLRGDGHPHYALPTNNSDNSGYPLNSAHAKIMHASELPPHDFAAEMEHYSDPHELEANPDEKAK